MKRSLTSCCLPNRAPEDGYYMFTLVVRENGNSHCAGSVMRTPASDPNNAVMLCRAEQGWDQYQTGSCTVGIHGTYLNSLT